MSTTGAHFCSPQLLRQVIEFQPLGAPMAEGPDGVPSHLAHHRQRLTSVVSPIEIPTSSVAPEIRTVRFRGMLSPRDQRLPTIPPSPMRAEPSTPTQTAGHWPSLGLGRKLGRSYSACNPASCAGHPQNASSGTVRWRGFLSLGSPPTRSTAARSPPSGGAAQSRRHWLRTLRPKRSASRAARSLRAPRQPSRSAAGGR